MENQELNRYVGDYDHFQEVYEVKKAQLEAAYRRQQQEISEALIEYKGSILLICHEPEFYQDVVSQVWDCSKWTTKVSVAL